MPAGTCIWVGTRWPPRCFDICPLLRGHFILWEGMQEATQGTSRAITI